MLKTKPESSRSVSDKKIFESFTYIKPVKLVTRSGELKSIMKEWKMTVYTPNPVTWFLTPGNPPRFHQDNHSEQLLK